MKPLKTLTSSHWASFLLSRKEDGKESDEGLGMMMQRMMRMRWLLLVW